MKKRISQSKIIVNSNLFKRNLPKYKKIIKDLSKKFKTSDSPEFAKEVNFSQSKKISVQNWFTYKQGYSNRLIENILNRFNDKKINKILDPFCGVGTTNLVSNQYGIRNYGLDINPVALLAAKVKNYNFKRKDIEQIDKLIKKFRPTISKSIPDSKVIESSFDKGTFNQLMSIKGYCENISPLPIKNFFMLGYISIIEDTSKKIKDGNGLKNAPNKKIIKDVYSYFKEKIKIMHREINLKIKKSTFIEGSLLNKKLKPGFDLVIFSPPYANCFDYFEVYKLEMWMGGFVKSYNDFLKFRSVAIRSHVNSKFDHSIKKLNKDVDTIALLISSYNIWNKNIPKMIKGYFDDMNSILDIIYNLMSKDSSCFIVVANSGYKGILVPTDLLICEIAEKIGFKVKNIFVARQIRSSSQQLNKLHSGKENLMRESILELKK
jgi:DNA modification methylase